MLWHLKLRMQCLTIIAVAACMTVLTSEAGTLGHEELPHISSCGMCDSCLVSQPGTASGAASGTASGTTHLGSTSGPGADSYAARPTLTDLRQHLLAQQSATATATAAAAPEATSGSKGPAGNTAATGGGATLPLPPSLAALALQLVQGPHLLQNHTLTPAQSSPSTSASATATGAFSTSPDPPTSHTPSCFTCRGCTTTLSSIAQNTTFLGRAFQHDTGASSIWAFRATTNRTASGQAVVKVFCLPLQKGTQGQPLLVAPEKQGVAQQAGRAKQAQQAGQAGQLQQGQQASRGQGNAQLRTLAAIQGQLRPGDNSSAHHGGDASGLQKHGLRQLRQLPHFPHQHRGHRKAQELSHKCDPLAALRKVRLLLALDKVAEECGLRGLTPKVWLDPLLGVVPGVGYPVRGLGLWQELAQGISIERLLHGGLPPDVLLDLLHNRLNHTQVLEAAVFDLLTSQCDRHPQNVFISEDGQLQLIDNDVALQNAWVPVLSGGRPEITRALLHCGFDSVFLPTTQKNELLRSGFHHVMKQQRPGQHHNRGRPWAGGGGSRRGREVPGHQAGQAAGKMLHSTQSNEPQAGDGTAGQQYTPAVEAARTDQWAERRLQQGAEQRKPARNDLQDGGAMQGAGQGQQRASTWAHPLLLLDYRCYMPGNREELGTKYPPQVARCLAAIANKSAEEVQEHYGFLDLLPAQVLQARAKDMITKGFEATLQSGEPQNPAGKRYRIAPRCCRLQVAGKRMKCAHPWQPSHELPTGDPRTGLPWPHPWPDVGTYNGSSSA